MDGGQRWYWKYGDDQYDIDNMKCTEEMVKMMDMEDTTEKRGRQKHGGYREGGGGEGGGGVEG